MQHRQRIVDPGRVRVFRRQPVVHRDHRDRGAAGQFDALQLVGVQIAEHEGAAVAVHQNAVGAAAVDADRYRVVGHRVLDIHTGGIELGGALGAAPIQGDPRGG